MVINLIRLLVKQGVITQDAADALRQEAENEADQARQASGNAPPTATAPPSDVIRVPYVPQVVRNEIRDDIKKDVLAQAKAEGWASPGDLPSWINRFSFFGDFRFRDEFDIYSSNNKSRPISIMRPSIPTARRTSTPIPIPTACRSSTPAPTGSTS